MGKNKIPDFLRYIRTEHGMTNNDWLGVIAHRAIIAFKKEGERTVTSKEVAQFLGVSAQRASIILRGSMRYQGYDIEPRSNSWQYSIDGEIPKGMEDKK